MKAILTTSALFLSSVVHATNIPLLQPAVIDLNESGYNLLLKTINDKQELSTTRTNNLVIVAGKPYRYGPYNCRDTVVLDNKKEQGFISCNGGGNWDFYQVKYTQ